MEPSYPEVVDVNRKFDFQGSIPEVNNNWDGWWTVLLKTFFGALKPHIQAEVPSFLGAEVDSSELTISG